jgi:hypothetical protein
MALAQGSFVALSREVSGISGAYGKKPLFGRITNAAAPWDILWENGLTASSIPSAQLDEVNFLALDPFVGRVLDSSGEGVSGYYDGIVVSSYTRAPGGANPVSFRLLKTINGTNQWLEIRSSQVNPLEGR